MKLIRLLLVCLALVTALAAVLAAAALVPAVQTWLAQIALSQTLVKGSLGSLSAGLETVEIADLKLEIGDGVLTVPSLAARLPVISALWNRKAQVRSLVAKGWTLDLSRMPRPAGGRARTAPSPEGGLQKSPQPADGGAAQNATRAFQGLLGAWALPCDGSLDGVDLEGDVLVAVAGARAPARVHVAIVGGGLAGGREGSFALDVTTVVADPNYTANAITGHGRLIVAMGTQRTLTRIGISAELSDTSERFPKGQTLSVVLALGPKGDEAYAVDLSRGTQHQVTVLAQYHGATRNFDGSWKLDLRDQDLAVFALGSPLPLFSAVGDGRFGADPSSGRVHVLGRLNSTLSHLGVLAPPLERLGTVVVDATFDGARTGQSFRFDRLDVSFGGAQPAARLHLLQPAGLDVANGRATAADPMKDLLEISFREFPLAWLSGLTEPFAFDRGGASGDFTLRAGIQGFTLIPRTQLTASGVSLSRAGRIFGKDLDLSLSLQAEWSDQAWTLKLASLKVESGGRNLASIDATASRPSGTDQPVAISGSWSADLEAPAARQLAPAISAITGRSASGDFSASVGPTTKLDGKLTAIGHDPAHTVDASIHAEIFGDGTIDFRLPTKIAFGPSVSDVSLDGRWAPEGTGARVDVELSGGLVVLEHLRLLAAPLAAMAGAPDSAVQLRQMPSSPGQPDRIPFWGEWVGRVMVVFDRLVAEDGEFKDVRGTLEFDHGSVQLKRGRCSLARHTLEKVEGTVSFDANAEVPYNLKASAAPYDVDAAALFPPPKNGQDPTVEGHFSVASALSGDGINLADLIGRTKEELRLTSTGGIFRALNTSVAESIPEASTPVSDTLGTVGSAVGSLFGFKGDLGTRNPVSKTAQAVMDFTYNTSEIGYDQASVTAIRGSDHTIHLVDLSLTAPDERIAGSGQITYVKGLPLKEQPLSVDLQIWVRGKVAELLTTSGLLSSKKDAQGYTMLSQPVHFGGSLGKIDQTQWHDLLVKAATRGPEDGKRRK